MKTNRFLSFLAIFAVSFTLFACSSDSPSNPPGGEPSSSSPQQETQVFCQITGSTCSQMPLSTCMDLVNAGAAQIVSNCDTPPPPPSSSSATPPPPPPSSSSSAPRSSSSPAASTRCKDTQGREYFCEYGTNGHSSENTGCFAIDPTYSDPPGRACSVLVDECNSYGTLFSFTANSTAGGAGKRCDGTTITNDPNLVRKNITLSAAGSSYADIDGNVATYTRATAASRLDKIDLIAYCGTGTGWCEHNSIYSPLEIDLFWTDDYDDYLGGSVFFFEVPVAQASVFKTATKLSEIKPTWISLLNIADLEEVEIPIVAGKVFLVYTSERNYHIVIIKSAGTQTVDLEIIQVPSN